MSVYKHIYRAYSGKVTPVWTRVLVLARYGFAEAWSSKITIGLFTLCLLPPIVSLIGIYLANNPLARALMGVQGPRSVTIDARFFLVALQVQSWFALALASWIAPRLITFDLADNALPILLSHPISRFGYVLGKFLALFASLSVVTWAPCLLLFAYQGYSSPLPWAAANLRIAAGLLAGALIWIAFLSMLGLALSSWVKWRVVATGAIFAAVFVPAGVGAIVTGVLRTKWGFLLNIPFMMSTLWQRLLGAPESARARFSLPTEAIAAMLILACCLCVAMLHARIRAREVVRG
ncbi:MAG: ABC transporter permease subunit [Terracidiphilus sp.]|jgi:ABC-type transport system involved in multi-copper enzyme maturation permease subunit